MLKELEKATAASVPAKKLERQPSEKKERKQSTHSHSHSKSDSEEVSKNSVDSTSRQSLDVQVADETDFPEMQEQKDSVESKNHHHHRHHHARTLDTEDNSNLNLRRRESDSSRTHRRSRSRSPARRRSRTSRSRSRSPRGSNYSKRVVSQVLASRQRDENGSSHRRSREAQYSDEEVDVSVSSAVKVADKKSSTKLKPPSNLLMRAIAEAKTSTEGQPQSEISVPPTSALAKKGDRDDDSKGRRRRPEDRAERSLHVLSSDGGFISRSRQTQLRRQEEKREVMSRLLKRQIEAEEREAKKEMTEQDEDDNDSLNKSTVDEEDAIIKEFNKTARNDKSRKVVSTEEGDASSKAAPASNVLMKALLGGEVSAIPLAPAKNSPQFIVTMDGVNEQALNFEKPQSKLPLSQRLEPRSNQSITSRLGPPISSGMEFAGDETENTMEVGLEEEMEDVEMKQSRPPERCRFWPNCKTGDSCPFVHPTQPCKAFPNCRFGARCLYLHPDCKFDMACLNPECPYTHRGVKTPSAPTPMNVVPNPTAASQPGEMEATAVENAQVTPADSTAAKVVPAPTATPQAGPGGVPQCKFFPNCTNPFCMFSHPKVSVVEMIRNFVFL